ncbi:uncharacterized protein HD556DRAFT_1312645 [Suillus plorans]|uniref:Uncharacterized protein n=1 Tax=Suillus plorans TaxID=116603 RepID=A0A9P7DCT5_9AGAM|nr:uncharacterized protein HD556DRAFT_1312645 [Suillus plorans]KAG1787610.1 hypothetical protein HD556DRAFT_1312645 [Suillus plorans]
MPKKDAAPAIPDVHWSKDMTWSLLSEVKKDNNRLVLLGKQEKKENMSGDSKITVFQWIRAVVLPESYKLNLTATGKTVKWKYNHLTRKYRQHGKHLRTTGERIRGTDVEDNPSENEFFNSYVTVLGHMAKKTLHFQPPSNNEGDDVPPFTPSQHMQMQLLHDILTAAVPYHELSPSFESSQDPFALDMFHDDLGYDDGEKENASLLSQVIPVRHPPKPSLMSQDILERAKQRITKVPKKQGMEEVKSMDAINARADTEMMLKSRDLLLQEFTVGI